MTARLPRVLPRVLLPLLVALVALAAADVARADERKVLQTWNIAGYKLSSDGAKVDGALDAIRASDPAAFGFQEMCFSQFNQLRQRLEPAYEEIFVTTQGTRCGSAEHIATEPDIPRERRDDFGIALFSRARILDSIERTFEAQSPEDRGIGEYRKLLCGRLAFLRPTRVCVTHITNESAYKAAQITEVRRIVNDTIRQGVPTVLMGDLNVPPESDALDQLYTENHGGGAFGNFQEVDERECTFPGGPVRRCGEKTLGIGKFDYIFVSAPDFYDTEADALPNDGTSDHKRLKGEATLRG